MANIATVLLTTTFDAWRQVTNTMSTRWNALGTADAITITGGTIDGTSIGSTTPADAIVSSLVVNGSTNLSNGNIILANGQISGDKVAGGTITNMIVELRADPASSTQATRKSYVDAGIATVQTQADSLQTQITTLGTTTTSLQSQVTSVQNQANSLQTQLTQTANDALAYAIVFGG